MKKLTLLIILFFLGILFSSSYAQITIILQPDSILGKDAMLWGGPHHNEENRNYGSDDRLLAHAWTNDGVSDTTRSLIEFDLSSIPVGAKIIDARLNLYNNYKTDSFGGQHSSLSGPNSSIIRRIVEAWDESIVTWNTKPAHTALNEVILNQSSSPNEDFLNIDVTQMVKDMIDNPNSSFGFMVQLQTEEYYRALVFASSDHIDSVLHPKLVITYSEEETDCITLQPGSSEGKDAYTTFLSGYSNTGGHQSLVTCTWTFGGTPGKARSFLAFDLDTIPENATVKSAALSLFYNPTDDGQSFDYHTGDNEFNIQRIIDPWAESTICWNNQPNTTNINQVKVPPSSSPTQDYLDIDVTKLVEDMIGSSEGNHGFMLRMVDEINYYRSVLFASSNNNNVNLRPKLVVCFETGDEEQLATASAGYDVNLCYNSSFTLSGIATNGTISWLTSGDGTFADETTATPTYSFGSDDISNGSVTLTLIVEGNQNTATDEMIITIKPEATAKAGDDDSTYFDIPYNLSGSATDGTISWSTSGNGVFTNENSLTPTYTFGEEDIVAGDVTVTIHVVGSCNIATDDVVLSLITKEDVTDFNVYLYPNPTSEYATIETSHEAEFSMEIFNSLGQLVMEMPSIQSKTTFDVSRFATGNYLIRIINPEFLFIKKLVIHREF